jgi:hypothetical protein
MPPATGHGYSGTPLIRKLGLKPGMRVLLLDAPADYWTTLGHSPASLEVELLPGGQAGEADFIHLFATDAAALRRLFAAARVRMARDGLVWASWPKKTSGVATEVGRAEVMQAGKEAGLVDVKVCAVDDTWSGLKFVIPRAARRV